MLAMVALAGMSCSLAACGGSQPGSGPAGAGGAGGVAPLGGASGAGGAGTGGGGGAGGTGSGGSGGVGGSGSTLPTECADGIDNDGDGLVDWQQDLGCYGPADTSEAALGRSEEDGFTTFDIASDSVVVYVSDSGDDTASGASPALAVKTLARAANLVRDGQNDFILLKRGDTFCDQTLGRFKSGRDATHPLVVASYGDSTELPRVEASDFFINHDGQTRSFVAVVGLHFVSTGRDPAGADYAATNDGVFRYVGNGNHLLIEGCHLEYGGIVVQSYGASGEKYQDVEVRRNVVENVYHAATCAPGDPNGDSTYRPSGMYSSHVERLTIEGNLFDHNGWNQDVATACATIYNHNLYLNGTDVVIRDNVLARASSIHIKLRSDTTGDMQGAVIEGNYFFEGEIGVSIGGNTTEPFRFVSSTIRRNVFSDIGRSQPTTRTLAWGVDTQDNDGLLIEENYFLNQRQPGVSNSYAVQIAGDTERDVTVQRNLFYRIQKRSLRASAVAGHESIVVRDNTFADPDQGSCLIEHSGAFSAYTYAGNRYFSSAAPGAWFCIGGTGALDAWKAASGEADALALPALDYPEPDRSIESYAQSLGLGSTSQSYLDVARGQTRLNYDAKLGAPAITAYIRAGFGP